MTGIVEDQHGSILKIQREMVVFPGDLLSSGNPGQFSGHAEVDGQPTAFAEAEEHLFAVRPGGLEPASGEFFRGFRGRPG
ncbi:MAG: hypothetical protein R3F31_14460 [Verrucomicrobiales bacterium]